MIILLILTIYVIYKLYKILGEENDANFFSNQVRKIKDVESATVSDVKKNSNDLFTGFEYLTSEQRSILLQINKINPMFSLPKFINIVEKIHEALLESFSTKSTEKVENLLSPTFVKKFQKIISETEEDLNVNIIKINEIKIKDIQEELGKYKILVYIDSKQSIKNQEGIEKVDIKEILTFSCNTSSDLTKWELCDLEEAS